MTCATSGKGCDSQQLRLHKRAAQLVETVTRARALARTNDLYLYGVKRGLEGNIVLLQNHHDGVFFFSSPSSERIPPQTAGCTALLQPPSFCDSLLPALNQTMHGAVGLSAPAVQLPKWNGAYKKRLFVAPRTNKTPFVQ